MCCANKNFLTSLILWLITLFGLYPVADEWAATFADWTGISLTNRQTAVIAYQEEGETVLHAHVFGPATWDDVPISPAVITFHRTERERELAYALCRELADEQFVAITFEAPTMEADEAASTYADIVDAAMRWMHENLETLGVAASQIAVLAQAPLEDPATRLAFHAIRTNTEGTSEARASSSTLIYLFSPLLYDWEGARGLEEALETALWLDDVQSHPSAIVFLLSDKASSPLARYTEGLLSRLTQMGNSCKIVGCSGELAESISTRALRREMHAIAEMIHEALLSSGFFAVDEE